MTAERSSTVNAELPTPTPWDHGGVTKDRYVTEGTESEGIFSLGDVYVFPPLGEAGPVAIAAGLANAALIVKAVNSHDALVKALEEIASDPTGVSSYQADLAKAALSQVQP